MHLLAAGNTECIGKDRRCIVDSKNQQARVHSWSVRALCRLVYNQVQLPLCDLTGEKTSRRQAANPFAALSPERVGVIGSIGLEPNSHGVVQHTVQTTEDGQTIHLIGVSPFTRERSFSPLVRMEGIEPSTA